MPTLRLLVVFVSTVGLVPLVAGAPVLGNGEPNNDQTFNLTEYAAFFGCLSGAGVDAGVDCAGFDVDNDSDVDLADFSRFQSVFGMSPPDGMVPIPGGTFQMGDTFNEGDTDELPVHSVYVSPFSLDKYEVTNQQYAVALNWAYMQGEMLAVTDGVVYKYGSETAYCDTATSSPFSSRITWNGSTFIVTVGGEDRPMVNVSWYGAVAFCNWRSAMEGKPACYDLSTWTCNFGVSGYRLPTEAEWEKAARGGAPGHRFPWSDTDTIQHARANYYSSPDYSYDTSPTRGYHPAFGPSGSRTSPVGYFAPNDYGLHDVSGNVLEWCHDWYDSAYYLSSPRSNPTGPRSGMSRVRRGGGWSYIPISCRSGNRGGYTPDLRSGHYGFRCASGAP